MLAQHLSDGRYRPARHHWLLGDLISRAVLEGGVRAIVAMPPRHGKSYMVSYYGPVWALAQNPELRICIASYAADFAMSWGRRIRDSVVEHSKDLGVSIAGDSKAANRWHTGEEEGGVVTAGVDGQITGRGVDLLIIDDPVKNAEEARSEVYRDRAWRFWTDTAHSRLQPGASVIVTMTRWHEDDLAGRLVEEGGWDVISLPALAEEDDPIGRAEGEALWPEEYPADCDKFREAQRYSSTWAALYQQRPSPAGGDVFRRDDFRQFRIREDHYELLGRDGDPSMRVPKARCWIAQTVDTAQKVKTTSDYTVVLTFAVGPGFLGILRVDRARIQVPDQYAWIKERKGDSWFQAVEDKSSGIGLIQQAANEGRPFRVLKADVDKVTRAQSLAIAYQNRMVYHLAGAPWVDHFERELLSFPNGKHDDQVDCASYAAQLMAEIGVDRARPPLDLRRSSSDDGWDDDARDRPQSVRSELSMMSGLDF